MQDAVIDDIRAAASTDVIADLSHLGLIRAQGEEAKTFLHGQFTNDLNQLTAERSQLSAYCTPKGRMLALFRVVLRDDGYYLSLPQETLEATLKRLRMFVLRSKVTLDIVTQNCCHLGLAGAGSEAHLNAVLGFTPPQTADDVIHQNGISLIRIAGPTPRFELIAPASERQGLWTALSARCRPVGAAAWDWLDIRAGLPTIRAGTVEEFVPQTVNLQAINGLSFKKGCYPGQEIVARMQYLGKLKRRLYLAHVEADTPPAPNAPIYSHETSGARITGHVVNAQPAPAGGIDLLAVIEIEASIQPLHLETATGPLLRLESLPYPVDQQ